MKISVSKLLAGTGAIAVLFYITHVILGGCLWNGYSHIHQPISDLTANGAPNRNLILVFTNAYGIMALSFAVFLTLTIGKTTNKLVYTGGILFIIMHTISLSYAFFPEDLPGTPTTLAGVFHIIITTLIVPLSILSPLLIGFGLKKLPTYRNAGIYSVVTSFLILVFGGLTAFFFVNKLPYFGLIERLNIGALQLWTLVLSVKFITVVR